MKYDLVHVSGATIATVSWKDGRWITELHGEGPIYEACFAEIANVLAEDELGNCTKEHFVRVMAEELEKVIGRRGVGLPIRAFEVAEAGSC